MVPIKEALKSLLALILLAGFLELLLPDDKMRKYGQMVVGLIVLFSLISMVIRIGRDFTLKLPGLDGSVRPAAETLIAGGLDLRRRGEEQAARLHAAGLREEVEGFLRQITGREEIRVELPPAGETETRPVRVVVPAGTGVPAAFFQRTVAALLAVPAEQVEVEVEGGDGQS